MNYSPIRTLTALIPVVALLATGVIANDQVNDLIERIIESQSSVTTVSQRMEMTVTFKMDEEEEEQMTQTSRFVYKRPGHLLIESEMMSLAADGEHLLVAFPNLEYFMRLPIETSLAATIDEHKEYVAGAILPDVAALLSDDPRRLLQEFAEDITLAALDDEELNGRPHWVLRVIIDDDELDFSEAIKVWIDQESGLVSAITAEVDLAKYHDGEGMPGMPSSYALNFRVVERQLGLELDAADFAYDTTEFTEVADFDELVEKMQGGMMEMAESDLVGESAPDFELTLLDGETFRLADHQGKVVLVDFWATWCPPCVESLPYLQGMHEEFGDDVVMIGVSVDRAGMEDRVRSMLDRFGVKYLIGIDDGGSIAMQYGVVSIPTMVVVGADGMVQFQKVGFSKEAMDELKADVLKLVEQP